MDIGFYRYSLLNRGGDRVILAFANYLASLGHGVTLHVKEMDTVFDVSESLRINFVHCAGRAGFLLHASTHNLNHEIVVVDIIHLHLLLSLHNKVVYFAQADDVEYYDDRLARSLIDVLYRIHFHSEKPVIAVSQHLTDLFHQRYGPRDIFTLNPGIEHGTFYPDADQELLGLKGGKKAVFLLARGDAYRKGFDLSLQVLGSLGPEAADAVELWVVGNHLSQDSVKVATRNFGVVSDRRLRQILSSADIFFYPSRHEGFGLFPLEAMACGCVAVTTDAIPYARQTPAMLVSAVGDVRSLVGHLERLLTDAPLLAELRQQGIAAARCHDFEQTKAAFVEAVHAIVTGQNQ